MISTLKCFEGEKAATRKVTTRRNYFTASHVHVYDDSGGDMVQRIGEAVEDIQAPDAFTKSG